MSTFKKILMLNSLIKIQPGRIPPALKKEENFLNREIFNLLW